jgi:hypothetical protein
VHNVTVYYMLTSGCPPLADHDPGVANGLGFIACLVIATLAILGVFIEIPIISDYAV